MDDQDLYELVQIIFEFIWISLLFFLSALGAATAIMYAYNFISQGTIL